ncbi:MAG: PilN domain-containing protein [bacterium]
MREGKYILLNLVAERRRRERLTERRGRQLIWACVFLLAGIILYLLYSSIWILSLQADLRELEAKIEEFIPVLRQAEELKKEIDSLTPRIQFIQNLRQGIYYWQGLALEIQRLLPSDLWLDSLSFSPLQSGAIQIEVSGKALDYSGVGDFMLKLQATGRYQTVNLKSASLTKIGDREVVQFQLQLQTIAFQGGGAK